MPAEVPHAPQFAFEIAGWANDVGMLGVIDRANRRALVFCGRAHADAELTKDGRFRVRKKGLQLTASARVAL